MRINPRLLILSLAGLLVAAALVAIAADSQNGYGHTQNVTTTPARYFFPGGVTDLWLINTSDVDYYVGLNCDTNALKILMTSTNAFCVPANKQIPVLDQAPSITSVSVITLSSNATAYIVGI